MDAALAVARTFRRAEPSCPPGSARRSRRRDQDDAAITAGAYAVNFGRALRGAARRELRVAGVCIKELLHSVVALYDSGLPNVGSDGLYTTVCAKGTQTIVLLRDKEEAMENYRGRSQRGATESGGTAAHGDPSSGLNEPDGIVSGELTDGQPAGAGSSENAGAAHPVTGECGTGGGGGGGGGGGTTESDEAAASKFTEVYSDTESSEESSSSSEEEEDFSAGVDQFLQDVKSRRREREAAPDDIKRSSIGVECCLLSALTYSTSCTTSGEKVFLLQLLTTRKRFRKYGLGRFLLQMLKQLLEVCRYDAILVHADSEAVSFFSHNGFNDDVLLNSKFREYSDDWINTTMMSYFPEYRAGKDVVTKEEEDIDLKKMDVEIKFWRDRSLAAYQAQAVLVARMKTEILSLRDQASPSEFLQKAMVAGQLLLTQKKHIALLESEVRLSHEEEAQLRTESVSCRPCAVEQMRAGIGRFTGAWLLGAEDDSNVVAVSAQDTDARELPGMEHEAPPSPLGAGVLTALMGALDTCSVMEKDKGMGAGVTAGTRVAEGPRKAAEPRVPAVGRGDRSLGEDASCDEFKWSAL